MFERCQKKHDFLQRELNTIEAALKQAGTQPDEESYMRCLQQALMHLLTMRSTLEYFVTDVRAELAELEEKTL
ncbi:hypothetical protein KSD_76320 [Ktedonobacter sp. SOSP1-85]|uniref:hypothetical protein n=1 Tax=Ktedonobacter sp. SOSP1-85 TaxID=2778367 RepID=UPI0019154A8C|nr:hypothetical protein [Ktedonobacter sp. SOSP1-85]GHO79861.1 hypothetical protein KSD_76320 [Ktedonobacter sp. SOSP1-85]